MDIYIVQADMEIMSLMPRQRNDMDDLARVTSGQFHWPRNRIVEVDILSRNLRDGVIYSDHPYFGSYFPMCLSPFAQFTLKNSIRNIGYFVDTDLLCMQDSPKGIYRLFFATLTLDAIDLAKSVYRTFPDGRVMRISCHYILEEAIAGHSIFQLRHALLGEIFITGDVKSRIEQAGLVGFLFSKVWSSEEGPYDMRLFSPYKAFADKRKERRVMAAKRQHARKILATRSN